MNIEGLNLPPDVTNEEEKQWAPDPRPSLPEDTAHLEFASQGFTWSNHGVHCNQKIQTQLRSCVDYKLYQLHSHIYILAVSNGFSNFVA